MDTTLRRRTLVRGAAWAVPVATVATLAPAYAASCTGLTGISGSPYHTTYTQPITSLKHALVISGSTNPVGNTNSCQGVTVPGGNNCGSPTSDTGGETATTNGGLYLTGDIQVTDPVFTLTVTATNPYSGVQRGVSRGTPGQYSELRLGDSGAVTAGCDGSGAPTGMYVVTGIDTDSSDYLRRTYQTVTFEITKNGVVDGTLYGTGSQGYFTKGIGEYQVTGFTNVTVSLCVTGGTWSSGQMPGATSDEVFDCAVSNGSISTCTECSYVVTG